jgi:hypothetical protein
MPKIENNFDKMKENEHIRQDINRTISGAVEMSSRFVPKYEDN